MKIKKVYIIMLFFMSYFILSSLTYTGEKDRRIAFISSAVEKYHITSPQQKVYLHLNKPSYSAGENIWFKAYIINAVTHMPDTMSTNLYVELINSGEVISQIKRIKITHGFGYGDILLKDTVPEGLYQIRAYTNWMRNFSKDYYFTHNFLVKNQEFKKLITKREANINKRKIRHAKKKAASFDLQFFPEGGYLVDGLESVVGFKAVNTYGRSVKVRGDIYDSGKNKITSFSSFHGGMGAFYLTPEYKMNYYAIVSSEKVKNVKVELPKPLQTGVVLTVDNSGDKYISIELKSNRPETKDRMANEIVLIGQVRGRIYYSSIVNLADNNISLSIDKKDFPSGVAHLTVFGKRYVPLAERLVFINHKDEMSINIKTERKKSPDNDSLYLYFDVSDAEGYPVQSNLSLSVLGVIDAEANDPGTSILSYLLLSSDVKGYIENPGFYFHNDSLKTIKALDHLMLTQGWRRFAWEEMLNDEHPEIKHEPERYITIEGRTTGEIFKRPLKNCDVRLTILDEYNDEFLQVTGDKGYFKFSNLIYYDTVNLKIEARRRNKRKNVLITLNGEERDEIFNFFGENLLTTVSEIDIKKYRMEKHAEYKKELMEKEKRERERNKLTGIHSHPDHVITSDQIPSGYSNVLQVIQGRVPGVLVTGNSVNIRGKKSFLLSSEPLYLIDGVPVNDVGSVLAIPVDDIDRIEILKGPNASVYGSRGANGVIAVYTKRGYFMKRGVIEFQMLGYSTPKKFYQPKYQVDDTLMQVSKEPSAVFWKPVIQTNLAGRSMTGFSIPGNSNKYRIIVEGISYKGDAGNGTLVIDGGI